MSQIKNYSEDVLQALFQDEIQAFGRRILRKSEGQNQSEFHITKNDEIEELIDYQEQNQDQDPADRGYCSLNLIHDYLSGQTYYGTFLSNYNDRSATILTTNQQQNQLEACSSELNTLIDDPNSQKVTIISEKEKQNNTTIRIQLTVDKVEQSKTPSESPFGIARIDPNENESEYPQIPQTQEPPSRPTQHLDQESNENGSNLSGASQICSTSTQQSLNTASFDSQQPNETFQPINSEQQNQFKRATPVQQKQENGIPRDKNLIKIFKICKQHYQYAIFMEDQKIIAAQIIEHFSEQGTSDFMDVLKSDLELLESWINKESQYLQFLIKISFLYYDNPYKVQEILYEEKQIDVGVIKQKIIARWNEFIDYLKKKQPTNGIAKKQNALQNFSEKKNNIISACTKNMAEFFGSKIKEIISEQLSLVYDEVIINSFPKMVGKSLKSKLQHLIDEKNFKQVCLKNPQKKQILLQYRPLLELFLKKLQITSNIKLQDFLQTEGISDKIWGEILMEQKLEEKVKASTRIGKFLQAYYMNFIERLDQIRREQKGNSKLVKSFTSAPKKKIKVEEQRPREVENENEDLQGKELSQNSVEILARIDV